MCLRCLGRGPPLTNQEVLPHNFTILAIKRPIIQTLILMVATAYYLHGPWVYIIYIVHICGGKGVKDTVSCVQLNGSLVIHIKLSCLWLMVHRGILRDDITRQYRNIIIQIIGILVCIHYS